MSQAYTIVAKGDGVTDDSAALQAMLTAAGMTGGGTVCLAPGVYRASGLSVPAGVWLRGSGVGATLLTAANPTGDLVTLAGAGAGIFDLTVTAPSTSYRTSGAGVNVAAQAYDQRIERVAFENMFSAIQIGNGASIPNVVYLRGLRIHNTAHACIDLQSGQNIIASDVLGFNDAGVGASAYGFRWSGQNSVFFNHVLFVQVGTGFLLAPTGANALQFGWFTDCTADGCLSRGWSLAAGSGTIEQMELLNCWGSSAQTTDGMTIDPGAGSVDDILVSGFRAYGNARHGICLLGGAHVDIRDARCAGNSRATPGQMYGIYVAPGVSKFSITNSRIGDLDGYGPTQKEGILVDVGASDRYIITNNDLGGNVVQGLYDGGTGTNKIVANNLM